MSERQRMPRQPEAARHWLLDPDVTFLNHGSFGACPRPVLGAQQAWRDLLEAEPVRFLDRELEPLLDTARSEVAAFVGADPENLAFVPNATTGINTVLRSLRFAPGDELLTSDHEYDAALNALRFAANRDGARVVVAQIPFPIHDPGQVIEAILSRVTPRTRLALFSHVTSPTALIFPAAELVRELDHRGVDSLVDAAHAPGMVPLGLEALGAAYYTGNGHKWLCAPKGSAFLYVRPDRQAVIRPLAISHGANTPRADRTRFRLEFDWTGTADPSPYLALPEAIRFMGALVPGGWPEVMESNRWLAREGRNVVCRALGIHPPAPDEMLGAMAAMPLPALPDGPPRDPLLAALYDGYRIEVPVNAWPVDAALDEGARPRARLIRISAQHYNSLEQYEHLATALGELLSLPSD